VKEFGLQVVDATGSINSQQQLVRRTVRRILRDYESPDADAVLPAREAR
jgi:hypothetical protein